MDRRSLEKVRTGFQDGGALLFAGFAVLCSAAAGAAPAHPGPRQAADHYQAERISAANALAAHDDAKSLATAAALRFAASLGVPKTAAPEAQSSALELAARASDLEPQSASIGWLHLQLCAATPSCDIRETATAMRWIDADNAAAWLQTLAIAQRDKDGIEVDRVLADMALGGHFDLYWNRIVVFMVDSLYGARHELPEGIGASDDSRLKLAEAIAGVEVIPRFSPLVDACRESTGDRRDHCIKLAKTMQKGDTIIAQLVGLSIEKRLRSPDSKEARAIAERRRMLEWRQSAAAEPGGLLPWTRNARARVRLAHMHILSREEDVCIAILRDQHIPLDPPEAHP
jgi:hypothetical protein